MTSKIVERKVCLYESVVLYYDHVLLLVYIHVVRCRLLSSGHAKHDNEGRVITAEYEDLYVVTACKQSLCHSM